MSEFGPRASGEFALPPSFEPPPPPLPLPRQKFRDRVWLHAVLLLLTAATTTLAGASHYASFLSDFLPGPLPLSTPALLVRGLFYSGTILAILGAHEMGHYLACRYYDVDASLPYFVPAPLPLTGTLGAVIRIREPMNTKRVLFDIGVAGPIAGFTVAVPALVVGISLSRIAAIPPDFTGVELGEPLLFRATSWLIWGPIRDGYSLNLHPIGFAAWFGLLATALNLFPFGQLDGGHIAYAVLGRRSTLITLGTIIGTLGLTRVSQSWWFFTAMMTLMLVAFGPRHPRTIDEHLPLDRARLWVALFAAVMFAVCFTPAPIEPLDLMGK